MATGPGDHRPAVKGDERAGAELAASQRELVATITRQIDFYVAGYGLSPTEAAAKARDLGLNVPEDRSPDQISWFDLSNLMEADSERGRALWVSVKAAAQEELVTGIRLARSVEAQVGGRPYERAQVLAIAAALRTALAPRDGLEELLIHQMACAYELHLRWQEVAVRRGKQEAWHGDRDRRRELERMRPAQRERYEAMEGWVPSRVSDAEAIEQAVMIAERYQRAFLRLLAAFRETRRLVGILVVAEGQINIGEQQVNVAEGERMEGTERRRPGRSARSQHRRRAPQGAAASLTHRRYCHGR